MCEFTFLISFMDGHRTTFGDDYISCSSLLLPFQLFSSTFVQPAGCIRRIAFMRLQIMRHYFPYKETNQIIMSFIFGLWWHQGDSVSCMLLRRLWRLISSCVELYHEKVGRARKSIRTVSAQEINWRYLHICSHNFCLQHSTVLGKMFTMK